MLLHRPADGQLWAELAAGAAGPGKELCLLERMLRRGGLTATGATMERLICATEGLSLTLPSPQACELLLQHLSAELPVACAWRGDMGAHGRTVRAKSLTLGQLYPHPDIYRLQSSTEFEAFACSFAKRCAKASNASQAELKLLAAVRAAAAEAKATSCRAAGLLFESGVQRIVVASSQSNIGVGDEKAQGASTVAAECPGAADAVVLLAPWVVGADKAALMLLCDQWGVLHAPSGSAREYLLGYGLGDLRLWVHQAESGELLDLQCKDLLGQVRAQAAPAAAPAEPSTEASQV